MASSREEIVNDGGQSRRRRRRRRHLSPSSSCSKTDRSSLCSYQVSGQTSVGQTSSAISRFRSRHRTRPRKAPTGSRRAPTASPSSPRLFMGRRRPAIAAERSLTGLSSMSTLLLAAGQATSGASAVGPTSACLTAGGVLTSSTERADERRLRNTPSSRRIQELAQAIKTTFEPVIMTSLYPRSEINIYIQVLAMDGGDSSGRPTVLSPARGADLFPSLDLPFPQPSSRRR